MIAIAQARAAERQLACQFHLGDAEQLAFADHSFEVVTNRIVLWLLPHPGRAIHDWCRVLTPGGKLLIVGSQPSASHNWLRLGQRLLGLRLRQPAYYRALRQPDYQQALAQLPFRTASPAQVMALMEAAGLQRVHLLSGERIQQADQAARAGNRGPWPQRYILVGTKPGD
jgi:ubiquinone/menaquinone biosynthesis C-methylase UbiE